MALDLTPQHSSVEISRAGRDSEPNPIAGILRVSWDQGNGTIGSSLMFKCSNKEEAEEITRLLRRDSRESEFGVSIRYLNGRDQRVPEIAKDNGTKVPDLSKAKSVHFAATPKRQRTYTVDDVREWLRDQGRDTYEGQRLPKEITAEYRAAHGIGREGKSTTAGDDTGQPTAE